MTDWAKVMQEDWDHRAKEDTLFYIYRKAPPDMEAFYREGGHQAIALMMPFLQRLDFKPAGKRVLDIGCGVGRSFPGFKELGFEEIWGIDISREMVEWGRARCPVPEVNFVVGDGCTLAPLDSGYFDYCFTYNLFPCVPDAGIVLRYFDEITRVLRPGGAFQLHLRRNHYLKTGVLRSLPEKLRPPARSFYHLMTFLKSSRRPSRPIEALYASGNLKTWVGANVTPRQALDRLTSLGMVNLHTATDPLDKSDGDTFWVAGQKPDIRRIP